MPGRMVGRTKINAAAITTRTDINLHDKVFNDLFLSHSNPNWMSEPYRDKKMAVILSAFIAKKDIPEIEDSPLHAVGNLSSSILFTFYIARHIYH